MEKGQERPTEGEVVAMGRGRKHQESGKEIPMPCAVGDKVLYGKYSGTSIVYDGKSHQFVRDEDVMFVYSGDKATPETVKMIGDQILVEVNERENQTAGGLLLAPPDENGVSSVPKPCTGTVLAVGPGRMVASGEITPMSVQVGDRVRYQRFAGEDVQLGGEKYRVLRNNDILLKWLEK